MNFWDFILLSAVHWLCSQLWSAIFVGFVSAASIVSYTLCVMGSFPWLKGTFRSRECERHSNVGRSLLQMALRTFRERLCVDSRTRVCERVLSGSSQLENLATEFASYEDFLNSQIAPIDLYYLEVTSTTSFSLAGPVVPVHLLFKLQLIPFAPGTPSVVSERVFWQDEELARQLVELGLRGSGEVVKRAEFDAKKVSVVHLVSPQMYRFLNSGGPRLL